MMASEEEAPSLSTPPNSYADPSLFEKAMRERMRELKEATVYVKEDKGEESKPEVKDTDNQSQKEANAQK